MNTTSTQTKPTLNLEMVITISAYQAWLVSTIYIWFDIIWYDPGGRGIEATERFAKSKSVVVDLSSLSFICLYDCERHLDSQILTAATDNWIWDQTQFFINSSCVKVQSSLSRSIYHMQNEDVRGYMILFTGT